MKVLICEDNTASRTLLEKSVKIMNHSVEKADDIAHMKDILGKVEDVDIIFLGWTFDGKNAMELIDDIKGDHVPYIILITPEEDEDIDLIETLEVGVDDYIHKPLSKDTIKSRMNKAKTTIEVERRGLEIEPLEHLRDEHELLRRMVNILEVAQFRIKDDIPEKVLDWIGSATLTLDQRVHHKKETHYLISFIENAMEEQGEAKESRLFSRTSLKRVEDEHEQLEKMVKKIQKKVEAYKDNKVGIGIIRDMLRDYKELMREHLSREERYLFPLSEKYIDDDTAEELMLKFDKIEEKEGYDKLEKFKKQISQGEKTLYLK